MVFQIELFASWVLCLALQTKKLTENVVRGNTFIFAANSNFLEDIKIDFNSLHALMLHSVS